MPFPPLIEEISPETIGEDRIVLQLTEASRSPRAFRAVEISVDYSACAPGGVVLPLELLIQAPSPSGFRRTVIRRSVPSSIAFIPREGGLHFVLLRERQHNRWLGKLRVPVAGDPLNPTPPA
jgi:hypothetical protein